MILKPSQIGILSSGGQARLRDIVHLNQLDHSLPVVSFNYNTKDRLGILIGDDPRPGTNNIAVHILLDGHYQTFNKSRVSDMKQLGLILDFL